jgi:surfeit locus 1 family protein
MVPQPVVRGRDDVAAERGLWHGRALAALIATLAGTALTLAMGLWQLDRAAQKDSLQRALRERAALPEVDTRDLADVRGDNSELLHRRVRVVGRWLAAHTVFLDNRQMNGRTGFYVVTPLALRDSGMTVAVQRGWVPRDPVDPARLPAFNTPPGDIVVTGRIAPPPARLLEMGSATPGPIRHNLDLADYALEIGAALAPVSIRQEGGSDEGLSRQWPQASAGIHKHYGYAVQWFALSALMAGFYVWYQILGPRLRQRR